MIGFESHLNFLKCLMRDIFIQYYLIIIVYLHNRLSTLNGLGIHLRECLIILKKLRK